MCPTLSYFALMRQNLSMNLELIDLGYIDCSVSPCHLSVSTIPSLPPQLWGYVTVPWLFHISAREQVLSLNPLTRLPSPMPNFLRGFQGPNSGLQFANQAHYLLIYFPSPITRVLKAKARAPSASRASIQLLIPMVIKESGNGEKQNRDTYSMWPPSKEEKMGRRRRRTAMGRSRSCSPRRECRRSWSTSQDRERRCRKRSRSRERDCRRSCSRFPHRRRSRSPRRHRSTSPSPS